MIIVNILLSDHLKDPISSLYYDKTPNHLHYQSLHLQGLEVVGYNSQLFLQLQDLCLSHLRRVVIVIKGGLPLLNLITIISDEASPLLCPLLSPSPPRTLQAFLPPERY